MNDLNHGRRCVNGILLLDKPRGLSSNNILQKVKRLFRANKAGHTGALDPLATGMLPICLGEATKLSRYLLNADKSYHVIAKLGERTDTADADGKIISIRPVYLNQYLLESTLYLFRGKMNQVPPMFSALKYKGSPLYKYARKGMSLMRQIRTIHVYNVFVHNWDLTKLELEIHCSKGTYIRTIIDDLGEYLGCGAHVTELRRLTVSHYSKEKMISFSSLQSIASDTAETKEMLAQLDAFLLPIESAV